MKIRGRAGQARDISRGRCSLRRRRRRIRCRSIDMHPAEYVSAASLVAVPSNSNAAQVKLVNNTPDEA